MTRDQWNARALLGTLDLDPEQRTIERRKARAWLRQIAEGNRITRTIRPADQETPREDQTQPK